MPSSPKPIGATFFPAPDRVIVTFNVPLAFVMMLDIPNWAVVLGGAPRPITGASTAGANVNLQLGVGAPVNAANHVSFDPPPFDVIDAATGEPAPAFSQYPVT